MITFHLAWTTLIACLGTFQFGYHLSELNSSERVITCKVKIPGSAPTYEDSFWGSRNYKECIPMTSEDYAIATCIFSLGGLLSSTVAGSLANKLGRKKVCFIYSMFYCIGGYVMMTSNTLFELDLGRFISGLAAGSYLVITPMLINEVTPVDHRGFLGSLSQAAVAFGILISQLISYKYTNNQQWRNIFCFSMILGAANFLLLFTTCESPKWLTLKSKYDEAFYTLSYLRYTENEIHEDLSHWKSLHLNRSSKASTPLLQSVHELSVDPYVSISIKEFLTRPNFRGQLRAVMICMTASQLTGINSITFYGVNILANLLPENVLLVNLIISIFNFCSCLTVSRFIDKVGRKPLLSLSIVMMGVSSFFITVGLVLNQSLICVAFVLIFVIGYSMGLGAIPFLIVSEFTRHDCVGAAQSIGGTLNWISTLLLAYLFPILKDRILHDYVFLIFTIICAIYFVLCNKFIPETRGKPTFEEVWDLQ
ncbi:hypothetical protein PACTADRAFT_43190 [Pachysolen tannophilus NRRL Y-2460]|uniref:Major facilitator superfamily (MFS) profile domain-containing protein n=1 Tax=Pachysolen tannophilus NRRL Y-2460 TaxID=669874 RepID=A0A1E4TS49_PACTA|nr:hypothetical protein PACTADRAFT_43190 [Pachysolen tannophilus NRRL Y-2460]